MSVVAFLLVLGLVAALAVAVPSVVGYAKGSDKRTELRESKRREAIATKALRRIANDAGNPALEASIALDEIEATYLKELN